MRQIERKKWCALVLHYLKLTDIEELQLLQHACSLEPRSNRVWKFVAVSSALCQELGHQPDFASISAKFASE
jgi:hypothetical protein